MKATHISYSWRFGDFYLIDFAPIFIRCTMHPTGPAMCLQATKIHQQRTPSHQRHPHLIPREQLGFNKSRVFIALIFLPKCNFLLMLLRQAAKRTPVKTVVSLTQQVFGGLVWILVASSLVPWPLVQGWVMFVSVFCFVATTTLIVLYIIGAHGGETSWVTLDAAYHCTAALFYLSASVLEALATIRIQDGFTFRHYHENIAAVVFSYVATLLYVVHAVFSLIRWKSS
uniref:Myelin and lymphocyte protein n=1 Tax=Callithrix jacchus TaxID=9483 RepID=A0A8I3W411_CALJA